MIGDYTFGGKAVTGFAGIDTDTDRLTLSGRVAARFAAIIVVSVTISLLWRPEVLAGFVGVVGASAGYGLHRWRSADNPYLDLRPVYGLPRFAFIILLSGLCMVVGTALFFASIVSAESGPIRDNTVLSAAAGFYFFGGSFGIFGWLRLSRARDRLRTAAFDKKTTWRTA